MTLPDATAELASLVARAAHDRGGINPAAVKALIPASLISILCVVVPGLEALADLLGIAFLKMLSNFSLLIAMLIGGWLYWRFMTRTTPR